MGMGRMRASLILGLRGGGDEFILAVLFLLNLY